MMGMVVDVGGLALIAFIVWWFWLYTPKGSVLPLTAAGREENTQQVGAAIDVLVADGVYTPAEIALPAGQETQLRFLRRDRSPCAETLLIDGLGISVQLPVDVPVLVRVRPEKAGHYPFTCQMRMYRGVLLVTDIPGDEKR